MTKCNPDALEVLKSELQFLERGGYKCCLLRPWRPQLAFIESRTCQKNAVGWTPKLRRMCVDAVRVFGMARRDDALLAYTA